MNQFVCMHEGMARAQMKCFVQGDGRLQLVPGGENLRDFFDSVKCRRMSEAFGADDIIGMLREAAKNGKFSATAHFDSNDREIGRALYVPMPKAGEPMMAGHFAEPMSMINEYPKIKWEFLLVGPVRSSEVRIGRDDRASGKARADREGEGCLGGCDESSGSRGRGEGGGDGGDACWVGEGPFMESSPGATACS
jgi:hypothetical protein